MKKTPEHIINEAVDMKKSNPQMTAIKIAEILNKKYNTKYSDETIRLHIKNALNKVETAPVKKELTARVNKTKSKLQELNEAIVEEKKYEITDEFYIFYTKREGEVLKYPIEIKTVDAIFKDYSKHGNNLSGEQILQKYNIKIELFNLIKNRLRLYKASHVISPVTMERLSEEDLQKHIDGAIDDHITDRYREKFVKTFEKKKHKDYVDKSKILANIDNFLEHLQKYINGYEPKTINVKDIPKIENNDEITVLFSDIHIGKQNTQAVLDRLNRMTYDLVNRSERKINLICLGDIIETIAEGGMHPGQIESMDGIFGFDLLMMTISALENMFIKLYEAGKEIEFYGLTGNHLRVVKHHDCDQERIVGLVAYELIKRGLQKLDIKIEYFRDKWNSVDLQGFRYILHHGDEGATRKNVSSILWEKGDRTKHNIIAFGDKHHLEGFDVSDNATKIIVPALAGANIYDKGLLLSSYPGYVIVEKDKLDGTPSTLVRRLK